MPEEYVDPSGNTEQFRAFVQRSEPAQTSGSNRLLAIGIVCAVVVVLAVVAILAL